MSRFLSRDGGLLDVRMTGGRAVICCDAEVMSLISTCAKKHWRSLRTCRMTVGVRSRAVYLYYILTGAAGPPTFPRFAGWRVF